VTVLDLPGTATIPPLRPYQDAGVQFLRDHPRAYLADDPGLGKSRQLIEASVGETLILAPAMILDSGTWKHEVDRWSDDPSRFTYAPYTSLCRRETTPGPLLYQRRAPHGDKMLTSDLTRNPEWEQLIGPYPDRPVTPVLDKKGHHKRGRAKSKVIPVPRLEFHKRWDTIICDEAQLLKGRKTTWVEALKILSKMAGRLWMASGTPISNWAPELFAPLQLLFPEDARRGGKFGSYGRWTGQWFHINASFFDPNARDIGDLLQCYPECLRRPPTDPCEHYERFFRENLGDRYIQRLRDDVLPDLPPMTMQTIETPMTARQAVEYRRMKKACLATTMDGNMLVAWNQAAAHVKLDQMATGLGLFTGGVEESGKLDRLRFDLANRAQPTLVVAHYRTSVAACAEVSRSIGARTAQIDGGTSKADRLRHVQDFQGGRLDVLVGSLETVSEGLTLTAADMVIYVEHSWKPSRNEQALRRIHRLGQTRPVTALDYVTPGTVDQGKRELLATKQDRQMRVLKWGVVKALL
jgi:SNF2 family DNA or RNA helicase